MKSLLFVLLIFASTVNAAPHPQEPQCVKYLENIITQGNPERWENRKAWMMWQLLANGVRPCVLIQALRKEAAKK